jgi:6-phosphogluconolactonase (cycloisomerase 2 family)
MTTFRKVLSGFALFLAFFLQGCSGGGSGGSNGGTSPTLTGPEFVYVGTNAQAGNPTEIAIFPVNLSTGALSTPTIMPNIAVGSTAVDPSGKVFYAADGITAAIHEYSINGSTGALTEFVGSPFPFPVTPIGTPPFGGDLFVDTREKFVYDVGCGYNRDSAGALTPIIPGHCFDNVGGFRNVVHPSDKVVFSICNATDFPLCIYSINQQGVLVRVGFGDAPRFEANDMAMHPSGNFVYASGDLGPSAEQIAIFSFDGVSNLNLLTEVALFALESPTGLAITPNGKFLYAANPSGVFAFSVNATDGSLTQVSGSPFAGGHSVLQFTRSLQVDNTGQFLYLAATDINAVVAFKIDPNSGALSPIPGSPFPIGATPSTMTVVRTP